MAQSKPSAGCPHGRCQHSELVHVKIVDGYGPAAASQWGNCSVCTSQAMHGEAGEHPCARADGAAGPSTGVAQIMAAD